MYDRKTWIVVIACSLLLAVNIFFNQKNTAAVARQKQQEEQRQAIERAAKAPEPAPAVAEGSPPVTPAPGLEDKGPQPAAAEQLFTLETPETIFILSSYGGGVKTAQLKNQSDGVEGPVLGNRHGSSPIGALADGIDQLEGQPYEYVAADSVAGRKIVFRGRLPSGLVATKTWSLIEGGAQGTPYQLSFQLALENGKQDTSLSLENYSLFLGAAAPVSTNERREQSGFVFRNDGSFKFISAGSFAGGWFSKEKLQLTESAEKLEYAGVTNQFFATVVKPAEAGSSLVWAKVSDLTLAAGAKPVKVIRAGLRLPTATLAPGEKRAFNYTVFVGPKENRMLRKMGADWADLMNYGFFSPVSRFMNWTLWWVHAGMEKISGKWSWGLAVIVLTLLLRTAIWPLYNRSNRTMKRMSKLKPEMDKLREKYPDDPNRMNQEMMKMYRTYGINPLGGCLPMFAQLPIFFGFFSMLQHAVEMRGASFLWWVKDLSLPDTVYTLHLPFPLPLFGDAIPINPLPIIMAFTSFAQMAMMPNTGGDKTQMAVLKFMPFMFLFMCYNFASALALYWTTSNIFSIVQTWISNRMPEPALVPKKAGGGKSWVERMAEKAEQQQRMRQASGRVVDEDDEPKKRRPRTGG